MQCARRTEEQTFTCRKTTECCVVHFASELKERAFVFRCYLFNREVSRGTTATADTAVSRLPISPTDLPKALPTPELRDWVSEVMDAEFGRLRNDQNHQKRVLGRKKVELEKQNARLLSLYLEGHLDAGTYQDKSVSLQGQIAEVEKGIAACRDMESLSRDSAKKVFDFTQQAAEIWHGSKKAGKQRILRALSLNRTLSDTSLCITKRKPFSFLTERLPVRLSRGDCPNLERNVVFQPYVTMFLHPPAPHILRINELWRALV